MDDFYDGMLNSTTPMHIGISGIQRSSGQQMFHLLWNVIRRCILMVMDGVAVNCIDSSAHMGRAKGRGQHDAGEQSFGPCLLRRVVMSK